MFIFLNLKTISLLTQREGEKRQLAKTVENTDKKINACQITVTYPGLKGNYDMRALKKKKGRRVGKNYSSRDLSLTEEWYI